MYFRDRVSMLPSYDDATMVVRSYEYERIVLPSNSSVATAYDGTTKFRPSNAEFIHILGTMLPSYHRMTCEDDCKIIN